MSCIAYTSKYLANSALLQNFRKVFLPAEDAISEDGMIHEHSVLKQDNPQPFHQLQEFDGSNHLIRQRTRFIHLWNTELVTVATYFCHDSFPYIQPCQTILISRRTVGPSS
jgi:hypothetical protein